MIPCPLNHPCVPKHHIHVRLLANVDPPMECAPDSIFERGGLLKGRLSVRMPLANEYKVNYSESMRYSEKSQNPNSFLVTYLCISPHCQVLKSVQESWILVVGKQHDRKHRLKSFSGRISQLQISRLRTRKEG